MCDPTGGLATLGMALSAGGTLWDSYEQNKNQKRITSAKNDAFEANRIRQRKFQDESGQAFGENVQNQGRDNLDEQRVIDEEKFKQAFAERRPQTDYNVGQPASAPKNVVLAKDQAFGEADAIVDRNVGNLAGLTGYGRGLFNQDLDRSKFARLFGNIRDKAARDNALLPNEIRAAGVNADRGPKALPQLMKAVGSGLSLYGAAGGGMPSGWAFGGDPSQVVNGVPIPGTKPTYIKNPFGSQIGAT